MNIEHISISRESIFTQCNLKYKYQYHLRLPMADPPPIHFTFGKIAHRIIEEHTKARGKWDINDITKSILEGKMNLEGDKKAPPLDYDQKKRLTKHIANYLRLTEKIGMDGDVEWFFNVDLDPPHKRMLTGVIDRMIKKKDGIFIFDYKTTKPSMWRKDHRTITKDLQLQCYCWVASKAFKIPAKSIRAALYYLEDAKLVPACFCEETLNQVPTRLLEIYKQIETMDEDRVNGNVGDHCRRCDFRKTCSAYKLTESSF